MSLIRPRPATRAAVIVPSAAHRGRRDRRPATLAVALALVTLAAAPVAGAASWSAPQDLSAPSTETPFPIVAGAGDGIFATVWARAGSPDRPTEGSFRPSRGSWSAPLRLSPGPSPTALPYVAVNAAGQAAAAWTADDVQYVSVRGADGAWSAPRPFGKSFVYPSRIGVVVDAVGVVTVVWTDYAGGDTSRVLAMSRDVAGSWEAPVQLSGTGNSGLAAVGVAADRTVTVLFSGVVTRPGDQRQQVVTRSPSGSWSAPLSLSAPAAGVGVAAMDVAPSGAAVVAWSRSSLSDAPAGQIEATVRSTDGTWSPAAVVATSPRRAQLPDVAMTPQGTATVGWHSLETEDPNDNTVHGTGTGTVVTTSKAPDGPWSAPEAISRTGRVGSFDAVELAGAATGETTAAWSMDGRIDAAVRSPAGSWGAPEPVSSAGQDSVQPRLAADAQGAVAAVWQRRGADGQVVQASIRTDEAIVPGPGPGTGTTGAAAGATPGAAPAPTGGATATPPTRPTSTTARPAKATPKGAVRSLPRTVRRRSRLTLRTSGFGPGTKLVVTWTRHGRTKAALRATVRVRGDRVRVRAPRVRGTYALTVKRGARTVRKGRVRVR